MLPPDRPSIVPALLRVGRRRLSGLRCRIEPTRDETLTLVRAVDLVTMSKFCVDGLRENNRRLGEARRTMQCAPDI